MELLVIDESEMTPEMDAGIREGLCECFPADADVFSRTRAWHGSLASWSILLREPSGHIVAHTGVVDRKILAGDVPLHVAGIQNVFVLPDQRGKGLSDRVMVAAMKEAAAGHYDCGLLFCVPELEKVYARCGWKRLADVPVIRINERRMEVPIPGKNIAMFYPLKVTEFPAGRIHLQGNDW